MTNPENLSREPLESVTEIRKRMRQSKTKTGHNGSGQKKNMQNSFSGLKIVQTDVASYAVYLPTNQQIAMIALPPTRQYIRDAQALSRICKTLAERWQNP